MIENFPIGFDTWMLAGTAIICMIIVYAYLMYEEGEE